MAFPDLELIPFFQWLFRTSVQASVLVCLILAVQAVLRRKLGARWHYCLWLLLLVRLVMPGAPESSFSVFNLMPFGQGRQATVEPEVIVLGRTEPAEPVSLSMPAPVPFLPGQLADQPLPARRAPFRVQPVPMIWALGALLVAIYAIGQNIALSSRIARQRQVTDEGVLSLLENCKATMGVRAYLSVVETPRVKSPALLGFIRPRLLLPDGMVETLGRDELRYVFLHELAHLKRRDIAVNWLMAVLQLMHWFNPLIWYAFYRMRADREIACDALVLSRTQPGESKSYGRTIVRLLERFSQARRLPGLAGIVEDKSQIKRRITMIAHFRRESLLRSACAMVLILAVGCVALTDAREVSETPTTEGDSLNEKIARLDIDNATLGDVVETLGEPLEYRWGTESFTRDDLPSVYCAVYPNEFLVVMRDALIEELRHNEPGYLFQGKLQVGSSLEEVLKVVGQPTETVEGRNEWKQGVLYKDINGTDGYCYYHPAEQNVRFFLVGNEVHSLCVTRSTPASSQETVVIEHTVGEGPLPVIEFRGTQRTSGIIWAMISLDGGRLLAREGERFGQTVLEKIDLEAKRIIFRWVPTGARYEVKMSEPPYQNGEKFLKEASEISELLDVGVKLYADGHYRDALDRFNRVLVIDPENETAKKYVEECTQYLIPGRVGEGVEVEYPEERSRPGPSSQEVRQAAVEKYLAFGQDHFDKGEYEKAAQEWERVLLIDPTNERATASLREAKRPQPETERPRRTVLAGGVLSGESPPILGVEETTSGTDGTTATTSGRPLVRGLEDWTVSKIHQRDESDISRMRRIREKLEAIVTVDFPKGTDIREVLAFLRDFIGVDIVLDERVMLPRGSPPSVHGARPFKVTVPRGGQAGLEIPIEAVIEPTIDSSVRRVYLKGITVQDALKAILSQMGLSYAVKPDFIWVSRPHILRRDSFEPLETRKYRLRSTDSPEEIVAKVRTHVPPVIQPYTGRALSYVQFHPKTNTLSVRNTPSTFELIEEMLGVSPPKPRTQPRAVDSLSQIREIEKKLQETTVSLDHALGTDVRHVLSILADPVGVNIVLDERVMLPPGPAPTLTSTGRAVVAPIRGRPGPAPGETGTEDERYVISPTVQSSLPRVYVKNIKAGDALKAVLTQMGLSYKVQPEFIWVSTPEVLSRETFEPCETRYYHLTDADRADEIMAMLEEIVPDIIEPYTGQTLSYLDLTPTTKLLIIHNTPSNLEMIEKILEDQARPHRIAPESKSRRF